MFSGRRRRSRTGPFFDECFDRPDIRVFTQALRSYSAHCLFARENGTAPEGLSNDISLGFVFGAARGKARRYTLLILRRYRSFTRLVVLKGDTRADKTTRVGTGATRREMKLFLSFLIEITTRDERERPTHLTYEDLPRKIRRLHNFPSYVSSAYSSALKSGRAKKFPSDRYERP